MEKHFDINADGYSVRCKLFAQKDARTYARVVICTHGYGGSKHQRPIERYLSEHLHSVLSYSGCKYRHYSRKMQTFG